MSPDRNNETTMLDMVNHIEEKIGLLPQLAAFGHLTDETIKALEKDLRDEMEIYKGMPPELTLSEALQRTREERRDGFEQKVREQGHLSREIAAKTEGAVG